MKPPRPKPYSIAIALGACFPFLLILTFVVQLTKSRAQSKISDGSNLRQIVQSQLIYASQHNDQLPKATDVWDYAGKLAADVGLESAVFWVSRNDPAGDFEYPSSTPVLAPENTGPRTLNPAFRALIPAFAVPIGEIKTSMPSTTPIAWTRGLQPDGTWAAHSPNQGEGGHIAFLGSNITFFKSLNTPEFHLTRFDGKGPTSNILEALPPGTHISEYTPSPDEIASWKWKLLWRRYVHPLQDLRLLYVFLLIWTPITLLCVVRATFKKGSPRRALPATIVVSVTAIIMTYAFAAWFN